ncbi:hypothetical protein CgunFtcFv8_008745 [Champsocephalus gunnari]|uniref:superoxide dismutase n=1 Tax=Champsocephalus gunnari TaxID=52237 RepID=A0AAN8D0N2_CHAGU|nr:hypothetical protein CgunFtcFv8_008745 [Champsocephalus gunnari]
MGKFNESCVALLRGFARNHRLISWMVRMERFRGGEQSISLRRKKTGGKGNKFPSSLTRKETYTREKMERMQGEAEGDYLERPSPLTDKEKVMIQDSWAKVYENCEDTGVAILIRLFVKFPSSRQYFSQFKHIEEPEELERSAQLRKHANRVMNGLNTLVESLDNSEKVASVLKLLGKAHALRHKVEPVYFKILSGVILEVLGEAFSEVVTPEVAAAWTKLLATMYCGINAIYEEVGWSKHSSSSG